MNTKVKGLALYFSAAVILQCATVLATQSKSDSQTETEEDLALLEAAMQTAHDSARRFIDTFSNIPGNRLDDSAASLETAQVRATRMLHSDEEAENNKTTEEREDTTDDSLVNNLESEPSLASSNSPDSFLIEYNITITGTHKDETDDAVISVLGNDTESETSQRSNNSSDASTSISPVSSVESDAESASNTTTLVTPEDETDDAVIESKPSQRSSNSSDASTSISPVSSVESDAESASNTTTLVTPEDETDDAVIESKPSQRSSNSSDASTSISPVSSVESDAESASNTTTLVTPKDETDDSVIESKPSQRSSNSSDASTSISPVSSVESDAESASNTTTLVTPKDETDDSVIESKPSQRSSNSSDASTSISPVSSVESDAESASNTTLVTPKDETDDSVIKSEASQSSSNSSDASTSIADYLIGLGSVQTLSFLNDNTLSNVSTKNSSSESLRQDVPSSLLALNNTNIRTLKGNDSLDNDIAAILGVGKSSNPDNVTVNISTMTLSEVVFNNTPNRTEVGSSKLTSPFRNLIDVINNVFRENSLYRATSGDTSTSVDMPAHDETQKYQVSLVNISSPEMKLNTEPINSVFDFLKRISEINPLLDDYDR